MEKIFKEYGINFKKFALPLNDAKQEIYDNEIKQLQKAKIKGKYKVQKRDLSQEDEWLEPKYYKSLYEIVKELDISYATAHNLLHNKAEKYSKFYKITKN